MPDGGMVDEDGSGEETFTVQASAYEINQSATGTVTINEDGIVSPSFSLPVYEFAIPDVAPAGTLVGQVVATQAEGLPITYHLDDPTNFTIDANTGEIYTTENLAYQSTPYTTGVKARIVGLPQVYAAASLEVSSLARPEIIAPNYLYVEMNSDNPTPVALTDADQTTESQYEVTLTTSVVNYGQSEPETHGSILLPTTPGVTFVEGSADTLSETISITGSYDDINTTLGGLIFHAEAGFEGEAGVHIMVHDLSLAEVEEPAGSWAQDSHLAMHQIHFVVGDPANYGWGPFEANNDDFVLRRDHSLSFIANDLLKNDNVSQTVIFDGFVSLPVSGLWEVTNNGDGDVYTFTPDPGFTGSVDLQYSISSESGQTDVGEVSIIVLESPSAEIESVISLESPDVSDSGENITRLDLSGGIQKGEYGGDIVFEFDLNDDGEPDITIDAKTGEILENASNTAVDSVEVSNENFHVSLIFETSAPAVHVRTSYYSLDDDLEVASEWADFGHGANVVEVPFEGEQFENDLVQAFLANDPRTTEAYNYLRGIPDSHLRSRIQQIEEQQKQLRTKLNEFPERISQQKAVVDNLREQVKTSEEGIQFFSTIDGEKLAAVQQEQNSLRDQRDELMRHLARSEAELLAEKDRYTTAILARNTIVHKTGMSLEEKLEKLRSLNIGTGPITTLEGYYNSKVFPKTRVPANADGVNLEDYESNFVKYKENHLKHHVQLQINASFNRLGQKTSAHNALLTQRNQLVQAVKEAETRYQEAVQNEQTRVFLEGFEKAFAHQELVNNLEQASSQLRSTQYAQNKMLRELRASTDLLVAYRSTLVQQRDPAVANAPAPQNSTPTSEDVFSASAEADMRFGITLVQGDVSYDVEVGRLMQGEDAPENCQGCIGRSIGSGEDTEVYAMSIDDFFDHLKNQKQSDPTRLDHRTIQAWIDDLFEDEGANLNPGIWEQIGDGAWSVASFTADLTWSIATLPKRMFDDAHEFSAFVGRATSDLTYEMQDSAERRDRAVSVLLDPKSSEADYSAAFNRARPSLPPAWQELIKHSVLKYVEFAATGGAIGMKASIVGDGVRVVSESGIQIGLAGFFFRRASRNTGGLADNTFDELVQAYAATVNENGGVGSKYLWDDIAQGIFDGQITVNQQGLIRQEARSLGLVDNVDKLRFYGPNDKYVDFQDLAKELVDKKTGEEIGRTATLPGHLLEGAKLMDRPAHAAWLNKLYGNHPGYVWHHMAEKGKVQLVPQRLHMFLDHAGLATWRYQ